MHQVINWREFKVARLMSFTSPGAFVILKRLPYRFYKNGLPDNK